MTRPALTRNDPADIARTVRREIRIRWQPCRCGCQGSDPWHRSSYVRVLRDVALHPAPICIVEGTAHVMERHEVARASARLPGRGLATVRCVVHGSSRYADWEIVED
jgi:hypothetical protein